MAMLQKIRLLYNSPVHRSCAMTGSSPQFLRNNTQWMQERKRCFRSIVPRVPTEESESVLPFRDIPGPSILPIFGSMLPYKLGLKTPLDYHKEVYDLYYKYGPVVREKFGSTSVVHVFDPADIRYVYQSDGKYPHIPPLQETTKFYRQKNDMSPGLGNVNGEEWYRMRHVVQQKMMRPLEIKYYLPLQDAVAKEAVEYLKRTIDSQGNVQQLHFVIARWILESAGMCCFERPFGSFSGDERERVAQKLVEYDREIFKLSGELKFSLKLYKFINTPKYRKLRSLTDFFYSTSTKLISEAMEDIKRLSDEGQLQYGQYNFLTYLMSKEDLDARDAVTLTLSLFTDGLSATAQTLLANIHCLALNPDTQERVHEEITSHIDPESPITATMLSKMHYLKAFVKEVFRTE